MGGDEMGRFDAGGDAKRQMQCEGEFWRAGPSISTPFSEPGNSSRGMARMYITCKTTKKERKRLEDDALRSRFEFGNMRTVGSYIDS